jgi:two-component system invasion response regulator UvrY
MPAPLARSGHRTNLEVIRKAESSLLRSSMAVTVTATVDVLIVDDHASFRSVARALVGLIAGWRVVGEAASGEEALTTAVAERPSVILMDINLPGINGIEATRRILSTAPDTTVVLLSTYAADDLPPDARTCGAAAYIRKDDLTPSLLREALPG